MARAGGCHSAAARLRGAPRCMNCNCNWPVGRESAFMLHSWDVLKKLAFMLHSWDVLKKLAFMLHSWGCVLEKPSGGMT